MAKKPKDAIAGLRSAVLSRANTFIYSFITVSIFIFKRLFDTEDKIFSLHTNGLLKYQGQSLDAQQKACSKHLRGDWIGY